MDQREFKKFVRENLWFSRNHNPHSLFDNEHYEAAKRCFKEKDLQRFQDPDLIIRTIACLIHSVLVYKEIIKADVSAGNGEAWKDHHKAIEGIDLMMNLVMKDDLKEITFKGTAKKEVVKLKGEGIKIIRGLLLDFYASDEYEEYKHEIETLRLKKKSPLVKKLVDSREANTEKKKTTALRHDVAFYTNEFLNRISPGKNERIIGYLFNELDLLETPYNDSRDDATIRSLINRGK